ncbi:hypothetical protein Mapa_014813 [Marchantia paleacea]|nr:hypothetical protein Mapa_014813 [Marchantia paleacea]
MYIAHDCLEILYLAILELPLRYFLHAFFVCSQWWTWILLLIIHKYLDLIEVYDLLLRFLP